MKLERNTHHLKFIFILLAAVVSLGVFSTPGHSAPMLDFVNVQPTDDGFAHASLGSLADSTLLSNYDGFPTNSVRGYILMKIDLTAATGGLPGGSTIITARLNLANLSCSGPYNINVSLWGMPDSFDGWSEAAMPTFGATETAFAGATLLVATVDEGTVDSAVIDYYHWTDNGSGTFTSWLESQRGGDGVVTLALIPDSASTVQVSFEVSRGDRRKWTLSRISWPSRNSGI